MGSPGQLTALDAQDPLADRAWAQQRACSGGCGDPECSLQGWSSVHCPRCTRQPPTMERNLFLAPGTVLT